MGGAIPEETALLPRNGEATHGWSVHVKTWEKPHERTSASRLACLAIVVFAIAALG